MSWEVIRTTMPPSALITSTCVRERESWRERGRECVGGQKENIYQGIQIQYNKITFRRKRKEYRRQLNSVLIAFLCASLPLYIPCNEDALPL